MWEWFTINAIWILILSALVLLLSPFIWRQIQEWLRRVETKKWHQKLDKGIGLAGWVIEAVALAVLAVAVAAVVMSREGVASMVTPETIQEWFLEHGTSNFVILVVGIGLWFAMKRFLPPLVHRAMAQPRRGESRMGMKKREDTLVGVFMGLGKVGIVVIITFMILSELGVPIAPILAGFGIAGIAVGFGAQYLIRDLIAGIFILMENQYRVGDVARVADIAGLVEEINLRKTVLRDLNGIVHHVPNGEIKVASNYTRHFSRVNLDVSVAYGTDLDHAISVINRVGQELAADENWSDRFRSAPQVLRVNNFGDSGIDIKVLGEVKPMEQWAVMGELRLRLKKAFDAGDIEIPWPHVKLYFGESQQGTSLICNACLQQNLPGSKFCSQCGAKLVS
ncbi:mechanosensitive ion channel domain-containing protein [Chloroflexota bacterium]